MAIQFLPPRDEIFLYLRREHIGSIAELSDWFYEQSYQALALHESVCTMPSLELVEVYLVQINYLSISKNHAEEVWRLRGIVTSNVRDFVSGKCRLLTHSGNCFGFASRSK